jgi:glycerate kinase
MPLNVLIIPDKFKGTLNAPSVAEAIGKGWRQIRKEDDLEFLPMSDGGDGFGIILSHVLGAEEQRIKTADAAHRPIETVWWWHGPSRTAIIESAQVIGLAQLPAGKYHPFELDTRGLGEVLMAAHAKGAKRCVLGIGGSATNDGGFGMACALGWQFFDTHDEKITRWTELHALAQVRPPDQTKLIEELVVAVDVQNPLLGVKGCTRVYGPQKGLKPADFEFAEQNLRQMAEILEKELHLSCANVPGSGAAGGLGFGLQCFAGARLEPGFQLYAEYAELEGRLAKADLVITGEGALDEQTLMGKGVGELAQLCKRRDLSCIGLAGVVTNPVEARQLFTLVLGLTPDFTTRENAMKQTAVYLEQLAAQAARNWNSIAQPA